MAKRVWKYFCDACGTPGNNSLNIRAKFMNLWLIKPQNQVHKIIIQCLPSFITWEIWKFGCSNKYDDIRSTTNRVIDQITMQMQRTLAAKFTTLNFSSPFPNILHVVERIRPQLSIIPLSWKCMLMDDKGNPGSPTSCSRRNFERPQWAYDHGFRILPWGIL